MTNFFHALNWVDYFVVAVVAISVLVGIIRGFLREVLSLVIWIAAFFIAFKFSANLSTVFGSYIESHSICLAIAFGLLFIVTLILGGLLGFLLSQLISKTGLSGTDRILGLVFGFARGILVIAVVLLLVSMGDKQSPNWWKQSLIIPHLQWLVHWLHGFLPAKLAHLAKVSTAAGKTALQKVIVS